MYASETTVQSAPVKRSLATLAILGLVVPAAGTASAASRRAQRPPLELVWYVENAAGAEVASQKGDEPINPASVVKVATTLWALERLGPDMRFETRCFSRGAVDPKSGLVSGDLVVQGSGDPDFHVENAFLLADALNQVGVRKVSGALVVNRRFWIGWENGSAGVDPDAFKRGLLMATRLRQALDPKRWNGTTRRAWRDLATRRGWAVDKPPSVAVAGGVGVDGDVSQGELLVVHRAKPLVDALRRFNCYSNNDIERLAVSLGPIEELIGLLNVRCDAPPGGIQLETTSGLGINRLTPRLVVRLLREFRKTCERTGANIESLLSVAGCDPGTVTRFFPRLGQGDAATSVAGKTGTLTSTDGGVAVLAGFAKTAEGDLVFCVAVPNAAGRLKRARSAQEQWLLDLLARHGGPQPRACSAPLVEADEGATIILVAGE